MAGQGSNSRPQGETGRREPQGETRRHTRVTEVDETTSSDPNAIAGDTMGNPPMDGHGVPLADRDVSERQGRGQEQRDRSSSDLDLDPENEG
jgi:hypothetical protein